MSHVVDANKRGTPLRTAVREFRPLAVSPQMQAAAARCDGPAAVGMSRSPVRLIDEIARIRNNVGGR